MDQAGELMAKVDVPYVQRFRDRHGKVRHYFRKPGFPRKALPDPAEPEFAGAYHQALAQTKRPVAAAQTQPGTLGALLVQYYLSDAFRSLKASTQTNYRNVLERMRADYGHNLVVAIDKASVREMLGERADRPGAQRVFRKRLSQVLDFAVEIDWLEHNPVKDVKLKRRKSEGFAAWEDDDIAQFEKRWPAGSRERRAMYLLLYTGQRRSDACRMGRQHVRGGKISVVQQKTGARLIIPMHPKLKAELDATPADQLAFICTAYGQPFSQAGFTNWFVAAAKKAGLTGLGPHGLRKAAGRRLAEAGCSTKQIMAVLGHKTMQEAARYTESADQERLADAAFANLAEAEG